MPVTRRHEDVDAPPAPIRLRYYLWDVRVPRSWLDWAERDIASGAWLAREVGRFVVVFVVLAAIFGSLRPTPLTLGCLVVGVGGIVGGREPLRRVASAYQRYGWDWTQAPGLGIGPYVRAGYAVLFTVVFVLLAR